MKRSDKGGLILAALLFGSGFVAGCGNIPLGVGLALLSFFVVGWWLA